MNIGSVLKTRRAKVVTGFIYSWGASVVLIGALFKLQNWPYSGYILGIGLITEAIIFAVSAFEPPLDMPEWSKVYPELKEDYDGPAPELSAKPGRTRMDDLFIDSDLTPELLKKVSNSLGDLSNTAKGLSDISSATVATDMYVKNLSSASQAMSSFSEVNALANQSINKSVGELIAVYQNTANELSSSGKSVVEQISKSSLEATSRISESGELLANSYKTAAEKVESSLKNLDSSANYVENVTRLNKNLEILNQTVENQLRGTEDQVKAGTQFTNDMSKMNQILAASVEELQRYQENAAKLNQHLEALNTIYGNMLGALNYKK
jgi:uncharacterized protein YukE